MSSNRFLKPLKIFGQWQKFSLWVFIIVFQCTLNYLLLISSGLLSPPQISRRHHYFLMYNTRSWRLALLKCYVFAGLCGKIYINTDTLRIRKNHLHLFLDMVSIKFQQLLMHDPSKICHNLNPEHNWSTSNGEWMVKNTNKVKCFKDMLKCTKIAHTHTQTHHTWNTTEF